MSAGSGQAALRLFGRALSWAARLAGVLLGVLLVSAAVIAVRLSDGPIAVTFLARRLAGPSLTIAHAALHWDRHEARSPLRLTLTAAAWHRHDGSVAISLAHAEISVAPASLLLGQPRPVAITAQAGSVALIRTADGSLTPDGGAPHRAGRHPEPDRAWRSLRRLRVRGLDVTLTDAGGTVWHGRVNTLQLDGADGDRPTGHADLAVQLGDQTGAASATLAPTTDGLLLTGQIAAINPSRLGTLFGGSAVPFDGPVSAGLRATLTRSWQPRTASLGLRIGPGRILAGGGAIAVTDGAAEITAEATLRRARLGTLHLALAGGTVLTGDGDIAWAGRRANAALTLSADHVALATLADLWPPDLARGARSWVVTNVTAGVARGLHAELGLAIDRGTVTLTQARGQLHAEDLTLSWLRPVPPLVHATATLALTSPDALTVAIGRAEQTPSDPATPALALTATTLRVTGLAAPRQIGTIDGDLAGPVAQAVALLHERRLHLLADHPVDLGTPAGSLRTHVHIVLPLDDAVTIDQIAIRADGRLDHLHLGGIIGGKDLDDGAITLAATNDGVILDGTARLAAIPSALTVRQDFRAGPAAQVVSSYAAHGQATVAQLQAAGLPAGGLVDGTIAYDAALSEHRNGAGEARVHVDLRAAALNLTALGWAKRADTDTTADATVRLDHDRLIAVDRLSVLGPSVAVQGHAAYAPGQPVLLVFDQIVLGQTRGAGALRFPASIDQPVQATLHGTLLDLSPRLQPDPGHHTPTRAEAAAAAHQRQTRVTPPPPGRPWTADLHFDRVLLAAGHSLTDVAAQAASDGTLLRHAQVTGTAGAGRFRMALTPTGTGRAVHGTADDAAGLLAALNLLSDLRGGTLALDAAYDDRQPDHPLSGTATIDRFRVVGAPAVARLLQAMTLYGVADVLRGPGLGITHLVAPFRYADGVLSLDSARAFSGSLGFTAKGDIDLVASRADLAGTIIPAYFFNTLLGKLPVLGKLFSPEPGGGVFAATYTLSGALARPKVQINPLAALTPGFLRGLFGNAAPSETRPSDTRPSETRPSETRPSETGQSGAATPPH